MFEFTESVHVHAPRRVVWDVVPSCRQLVDGLQP
jgi:hypothetical protein